jgi:hypothetical protein
MRRSLITTVILLSAAPLLAHTPYSTKITWSRDVSRIIYHNCASCHHQGGASFSLMTYREARPWAEALKQQVLERRMPPWNAVKGFGEFKDDRGLTQEDLEVIAEWVDGGGPEGNPALMPPAPDLKSGTTEGHLHPSERRLVFRGTTSLKHSLQALGIRADSIPEGGLRAIARRPNGALEPLIWIEKFNPDDNRTYYFRRPLRLPPGTQIEIVPAQSSITLVVK